MNPSVLTQPTLVLNRSWTAIATTTVRHGLGLIFSGTARVVRPDTYETHSFESWADLSVSPREPHIRTVKLRIRVPEVIVLTQYDGMPKQTVTFSRRNLYRRDRFACQYCGCKPGSHELTIDHVVPRSRGGKGTWENCVLACVDCNRRKSNRLPPEAGMTLLKPAIAPRWTPGFEAPVGRVRQSWERFVSDTYWNVPLEP